MKMHWLITAGLLAVPAVWADTQTAVGTDAAAAFARLKGLVGEWEANADVGKARLVYELTGGGSAVVERESAENMPVMMTVYHLDGNRLLLTHYCMAGNQPRMEARSFDPAPGEIVSSSWMPPAWLSRRWSHAQRQPSGSWTTDTSRSSGSSTRTAS